MAKKATTVVPPATSAPTRRDRLVKLIIKNFRCIGSTPVEIDLDDIVILVGPNNVGKSSILRAYEIIMSEGAKECQLELDDFPDGKVTPPDLPEIELHTIIYENPPGSKWIEITASGDMLIKEKWNWAQAGAPTRIGYNVQLSRWANETDAEKVPWGAPGVANSRRPKPHRVDAFASPDNQAKAITKLLVDIIKGKITNYKTQPTGDETSDYQTLLDKFKDLQNKMVEDSKAEIDAIQNDLTESIEKLFPNHKVILDAKLEDDVDKSFTFFKSEPELLMGPKNGFSSTVDKQGSGARRTLLWSAIRILADSDHNSKARVLLFDEPEICLHPSAVRDACNLLYNIPTSKPNWQVMVTTHSPAFIDFTRDHTSIVRVERQDNGQIKGTTIFRPANASFTSEDRENLKLLNICDSYVAEFFFGGRSIIVEGDTEYTAFKRIMSLYPNDYKDIHIIRARGKATIISLCKILNQFGSPYSVLHDSDKPTYFNKRAGKDYANPAWAHNENILAEVNKSNSKTRLIASVPGFESAYFNQSVNTDKPYNAFTTLQTGAEETKVIKELLDALIDFTKPVPQGATEWNDINVLDAEVAKTK